MNRIDPLLMYPTVANIVGQPHSSFSLRDVVEQGKILLVNIPQGELGEGLSSFLEAILVAQIQMAAMTNLAGVSHRPSLYLYIDEFQNFVTSAFDKIVTEARAFNLGLVVANQYGEQLELSLRRALDHNVAVRLTCQAHGRRFWVIYHRVQEQEEEYAPYLVALPPRGSGDERIAQQVRTLSRQKYATYQPALSGRPIPEARPVPLPPPAHAPSPSRVSISDDPDAWIED